MKEALIHILSQIISTQYQQDIQDFVFETPPKRDLWDLAFWCFPLAKTLKLSPVQIALELQKLCTLELENNTFLEKVEAAGPYLNFFFSDNFYAEELQRFFSDTQQFLYWDTSNNKHKHIVIDYIGANVGKPLHIGHMCTPNQGQVFINLFRKLGYTVISDSHIWDWGIIFWKLIYIWKNISDEDIWTRLMRHKNDLEFDDIWHKDRNDQLEFLLKKEGVDFLLSLYIMVSYNWENWQSNEEFEKWFDVHIENVREKREEWARNEFKLLSEGNPESVKLWAEFTKYSIEGMRNSLSRIYVQPDYDIGESFYEWLGLPKMQNYPDLKYSMKDVVKVLIQNKIATQNEDGSVGVVFPEELKIPSCILQKRDGTHGYLASDLASIKYRKENWSPERIIYFVDVRQQLHLKQAFTIAKRTGWIAEDCEIFHAYNGFISLKDGAMSTREGRIIKLDALFDEAQLRAKNIILEKRSDISGKELEKLSEIIGIGAIKYGYLKKSRESDVIFDWDEFMSFEGNSGPYIQYSYVRARKILEKSQENIYENISWNISQKEERELLAHFSTFSTIISITQEEYHAHVLCQFVYDASKIFSSMYANLPILQEEDIQKQATRIALLKMYTHIIEQTFQDILGIPLAQEM